MSSSEMREEITQIKIKAKHISCQNLFNEETTTLTLTG